MYSVNGLKLIGFVDVKFTSRTGEFSLRATRIKFLPGHVVLPAGQSEFGLHDTPQRVVSFVGYHGAGKTLRCQTFRGLQKHFSASLWFSLFETRLTVSTVNFLFVTI